MLLISSLFLSIISYNYYLDMGDIIICVVTIVVHLIRCTFLRLSFC